MPVVPITQIRPARFNTWCGRRLNTDGEAGERVILLSPKIDDLPGAIGGEEELGRGNMKRATGQVERPNDIGNAVGVTRRGRDGTKGNAILERIIGRVEDETPARLVFRHVAAAAVRQIGPGTGVVRRGAGLHPHLESGRKSRLQCGET